MRKAAKQQANRADEIVAHITALEQRAPNRARHPQGFPRLPVPDWAIVAGAFAYSAILSAVLHATGTGFEWAGAAPLVLALAAFFVTRTPRPMRPSSTRPATIDQRLHALAGALKSIRDDERAQFDAMHIQAMCLALLRIADAHSEVYDETAAYLMVDALARVGNAHAATWLERMAHTMSHERLPSGLRGAAERAAAALRERVAREHVAETLLRPAAPAEADSLLRPAHGGEEREPELLLRPTNTQDGGAHLPGG